MCVYARLMLTMHCCRDVDGSPAKRPRVGPAAGHGAAGAAGGCQADGSEGQAPSVEMGQAEDQVWVDHVGAASAVRLATADTWQPPCWVMWVVLLTCYEGVTAFVGSLQPMLTA